MQGFFDRLRYRFAAFMEGRYGNDDLNIFLMVLIIVFVVLNMLTASGLTYLLSLICMGVCVFRLVSKNFEARARENEKYLEISEKPRKFLRVSQIRAKNHRTTAYFKCSGCGQMLSVPKGKGTVRVVCPKCKTETIKKV